MKKHLPVILLILVFLLGLSLLLYPVISDTWNVLRQSRCIDTYVADVEKSDAALNQQLWEEAQRYNKELVGGAGPHELTEEERAEYEAQLRVSESGVIGYIEIPKLQCALPFYHGTDETVMQAAIGHLEGSSLPVGGESTHCVLSGHRGMPSARLFTDLDQMAEGDTFVLHVLGQTLTYEVDQILTVLPDELEALQIEPGQDYCTLVTCTPYGINTHRLLVRGRRVENQTETTDRVAGDIRGVRPMRIAPLAVAAIMLLFLVGLFIKKGKNRRKRICKNENDG